MTALNYDNVTLTVQVTAVEVAVEDQLDHVTIFWGSAGGSAGSSGITLPGTIGAPANSTGATSNATTDPFATCSNPPDCISVSPPLPVVQISTPRWTISSGTLILKTT